MVQVIVIYKGEKIVIACPICKSINFQLKGPDPERIVCVACGRISIDGEQLGQYKWV